MKRYDVIVAGGGLTGAAAAIASARAGSKTLLIEQYGCLGGMATVGQVNPFMPHYPWDKSRPGNEVVKGIFAEMLAKLERESNLLREFRTENWQLQEPAPHKPRLWAGNVAFDSEALKWILDEMVTGSGADIRFHTFIADVTRENGSVRSITTWSKSGHEEFAAAVFVDTTGDADLAYRGGFETVYGRESDGKAQAMTLMFRIGDIDLERMTNPNRTFLDGVERGELTLPGKRCLLMFPYPGVGTITFNQNEITGLDATNADDLTKAEIEGRKAIRELIHFLRANAQGFRKARVEQIAQQVGVRETRRIVGEHTLTVDELLSNVQFDDTVACGSYGVDIHDPEGKQRSENRTPEFGTFYCIPYRSLVVKGAHNLIAAGRCISATHEAASSVRIMPICTAMGQAAGEAAAQALRTGRAVARIDIDTLQDRLRTNGAFLG